MSEKTWKCNASSQRRVIESSSINAVSVLLPARRTSNKRSASSSVQTTSSVYTIDYSPKSSFLREMQKSGQVVKILPQRTTRRKFSPAQRSYSSPFKRQCLKKSSMEPMSKFVHPSPCLGKHCHSPKNPKNERLKRESFLLTTPNNNGKSANRLNTSENLEGVQKFRKANWTECNSAKSVFKSSIAEHVCTHEYNLNSRLLPQPLIRSQTGYSLCSVCKLPSSEATASKHFLFMDDGRQEIPDPALYKPKLRPLKHRKIAEAPTLSYVPHFRQRVGKLLRAPELRFI